MTAKQTMRKKLRGKMDSGIMDLVEKPEVAEGQEVDKQRNGLLGILDPRVDAASVENVDR